MRVCDWCGMADKDAHTFDGVSLYRGSGFPTSLNPAAPEICHLCLVWAVDRWNAVCETRGSMPFIDGEAKPKRANSNGGWLAKVPPA